MDFHDRRSGEVVHIPPAPGAIEKLHQAAAEHNVRQELGRFEQVQRATEDADASESSYGMGSRKALKQHLVSVHGAWPEDVDEHDAPARWHVGWHNDMKSWGSEDHTHG